MPTLPTSLTTPGLLAALCLLAAVVGVSAMFGILVWRAATLGGLQRQQQQSAQLDELHRLVTELSANKTDPPKPNE